MKSMFTRFFFLLMAATIFNTVTAQQSFFSDAAESAMKKADQKRVIVPERYRTLQLDTAGLLPFMRLLPSEQHIVDRNTTPVIIIPMPDGSTARFHIWESSVMAPELAAAYPELRTFTGQGIDDRSATIKLDWTEFGFHAMILSPLSGIIMIDPYDQKTLINYISYFKVDHKKKDWFRELPPEINPQQNANARPSPAEILAGPCVGTQLRTYRLAIACTGEYAVAATGLASPTQAQALAKIVITVNRVNGVFETEASVRMVLVANNIKVVFVNAATDRFTGNNSATTLINESQTVITDSIGAANYDIGHTFSTGGGGLAQVGCVCGSSKARGITGSDAPTGDAYDIDFVAHEMGHQFGANHSFNNDGDCGTTASDQNAEPGSGVTIMGYAGVCATDNVLFNSIPYFHAISFDKISTFTNSGSGNSCAATTPTGNTPPVVSAGSDYTIPKSTPFILTGTATDANGDAITYDWEQVDVGGTNGVSTSPTDNAPLFRSFNPETTGIRYFPKISDVIGNTTTIGERLPSYARTMHFRLTARDNKAAGGGVCFDENAITVNAAAGPFAVTYPTSSGVIWNVNDFVTVTWNSSGTAAAPINCSNVTIQLSTNGGVTFPVTLVASTPNDGTEEIQVPNNIATTVRIRVLAVGNIFYDISNSNLRIQNSTTASFAFNNPAPVAVCAASSGTATLLSGALGGFTTAIALSASLNPGGTTVSFGTSSLTPGNSTTVTLNNTNTLVAGIYTVRVTGVAGAITKTKDIQFIVGTPAPATLSIPSADATGLSTLPSFNWTAVTGAVSYTLEISTTSDFAAITQTISNITSLPYLLTTPLSENTEYYWRVKTVNSCGTGSPSAVPSRFKTGVSSCRTSTDVPKTIAVNGTPSVTSTITIPAAYGVTITDLNIIGLQGTHSRVNDLSFILKGPTGDSVTILNQVCPGSFQNFSLNLDGQSVNTITCPPTGGIIIPPSNSLTIFNGTNSAGTWTLRVKDNVAGSGGSLTGWGLNINSATATGCVVTATPLATVYTFTGNGNWNLASNWSGNTVPPVSLPAGASIVINHSAGGQCILNVAQTIAAGGTLTVLTGKNLVVPGTLTIQ
ncbi:MAG: proprotein convertase P-domain-containing protein [Chitinophagaceae bacterium]|nr:proprotein convertase P-domain-containing protein [Chitinophagaceae bacterium]